MRILIYAESFYPNIGGIENSSRMIATYLNENGIGVTVVTETLECGKESLPFHVVRQPPSKTLRCLLEESDLVYLNAFHLGLFIWAKLKQKKIVTTYRDLTPICPIGTKWKGDGPCLESASIKICIPCLKKNGELKVFRRLFRPFLKSLLSFFSDANVCTSDFGMQRFPLWRKRLILNGIDTSSFTPKATNDTKLMPVVLFVGRLTPEKGCQVLVEALHASVVRGEPFRIAICGDGPYAPSLRALVKRLDLDALVKFHGGLRGNALTSVMQTANIAVVPSIIDEPFGLVAVEAMSCGLPVIASNVGGLGGIVAEAGLVFERGDAHGLLTQIQCLLNDESLYQEMREKGLKLAVAKYDWHIMADRYHRLFVSLLDGKSS